MSPNDPSLPALTRSRAKSRRSARLEPDPEVVALTMRGQSQEIIDSVLADPAPQGESARARLRGHIAAHPGKPERALLDHLMETGILANAPGTSRIEAILGERLLLTAFQPICALPSGNVVGVEALTRFVTDDGATADHWFNEAEAAGLGADLEFAALHSALAAAQQLPPNVYVALNLSPATCLDPRLPGLLQQSQLSLDRIVLELTERFEVGDFAPLVQTLEPLRRSGLRIAVDNAGSGLFLPRHVMHLHPDIIKLDRTLIAGIEDSIGQRALAASMVAFARQIDADLVAEGIETQAELTAVTALGITAGQGFFLGRPSVQPRAWAGWSTLAEPATTPSGVAPAI
jgi:EAL domain-containing protein (putative c-di-GMP-specific phosphodiesterase class I)